MKTQFIANVERTGGINLTHISVTLRVGQTPNDRRVSESALYCHAKPKLYPNGVHYEMEINDDTVARLGIPKPFIHAIKAEDGKYFICYPHKMETEDEAERIFRIWSLGTVASMIQQEDVLTPNFNLSTSVKDFSEIMREKYGVWMRSFEERYL